MNAEAFKRTRKKLWPTQAAAARALGVHRTSVARWESGAIAPIPVAVVKLVTMLAAGGKEGDTR